SPDPNEDALVAAKRKAEEQSLAARGEPSRTFSTDRSVTLTTSDGPLTIRVSPQPAEESNVKLLEEKLLKMQTQPRSEALETEMANVKRQLELLRASQMRPGRIVPDTVAGRVLTRISFSGVSESTQKSLLANLPVKIGVGDTLTKEGIE